MTAIWTGPKSWSPSELLTASLINTHLRDNLDWLKTPSTSGRITFASDVSVTSTTYADVTGLTATLTTFGGGIDVFCPITITSTGLLHCYFQVLVDGTTPYLLGLPTIGAAGSYFFCGFFTHIPALPAGSHTIKVQCRSGGGSTITIKGTTSATGDPLLYCREAGA